MGIEEIVKHLLIYGPLGIFCALFVLLYLSKDKEMRVMQKSFLDKQEALMDTHNKEMATMQDRYVAKQETWAEKYRERADALQSLVEALSRK